MGGSDGLQCCYREQLGYAIYAKFREPKLFRMAITGDWDRIPQRCRSHPKEAGFVHKYPPADTALHRLLRPAACEFEEEAMSQMNELKLEAVKALLAANPNAATLKDSFGRTPLHLACMDIEAGSITSACLIANLNPDSASIVDTENRTPLHFLVARNNSIPLDLLSTLVQHYPDAIKMRDLVDDTPTDIVRQRSNEIENADGILSLLQKSK